jgi:hypothetical protein
VNAYALEPGTGVIAAIWLMRLAAVLFVGFLVTGTVALVRHLRRRIRLARARARDRARGTQARETTTPTRQYDSGPPTDPKERS